MKSVKVPSEKSRTIGRTYCNEIVPIKAFVESESATDFRGFEVPHNIVQDINDQLLCSDVQRKLGKCMMNYDNCLQHFSKTLIN